MNQALEALRPTPKQWKEMSHSNKEVLRKLDLAPKPKKRSPNLHLRKAVPINQGYDIIAFVRCNLCNTKSVEYLRMVSCTCPSSKEPYLKKTQITREMLNNPRSENHTTAVCNECRRELHNWTKTEMINRMIALSKAASANYGRR